ncbi:MAG: D-alanyl-lipoteichoic acid biosynthesis protein DltB [Oscillospiraceae bacterium]|nr:D-alanyl-lipoteichoic acid biosynthesis protein DltB [Oscillospiraceae bacterium]
MTPYSGLPFFCTLFIVLLPAAILGHCGKKLRPYGLLATVLVLLAVFEGWKAKLLLLLFWAVQTALCFGYLAVRKRCEKRWVLWLFLLGALAPLLLVKLAVFVPKLQLLAILGVSYMTFRAVQVLIETYDGYIKTLNLLDFSYFLLFFPSVSSGPLDRYRRFCSDLAKEPDPEAYDKLAVEGFWKLMTGAFYSFVVGNLILQYWLEALPQSGFGATVGYMYGYTFFMFFNFAGYSRMAIGSAYILGVKMPENFNLPFLSKDMKDFWSRWHISLSTWLRDYVYTRFCTQALRKKWFGGGRASSYLGYFLTMLLMGAWHGLTPAYLIYGAYHGILMSANELLDTKWKRFRKLKKNTAFSILLILITFHLFSFGLLIFSGRLI